MKPAEFARLVGVSRQAIAKHGSAGRLVMAGDRVDAKASLQRLEGHLDEAKRRAALMKIAGIDPAALGPLGGAGGTPGADDGGGEEGSAMIDFGAAKSWRAERERLQALALQIDLAERCGKLFDRDEILATFKEIVAAYWVEISRRERLNAEEIAVALKLTGDQTKALREILKKQTYFLRKDIADRFERMKTDIAEKSKEPPPGSLRQTATAFAGVSPLKCGEKE